MIIAGEDFTHVIDRAAREHGWDNLRSQAQAYEAAQGWLTDNTDRVECWVARPRYADVDALMYRRLLEFLRGDDTSETADNSILTFVISAGVEWHEIPTHAKFGYTAFGISDDDDDCSREVPAGDMYDLARLIEGDG